MLIFAAAVLTACMQSASVETDWGLHQASFDTIHGKVVVNLPDDMAAGDTISGTVVTLPAGRTEEEKKRNGDALQGFVIQPEGKPPVKVSDGVFRWALPPAGAVASLVLLDAEGGSPSKANIPLTPNPPSAPNQMMIPPIAQAGRPMECPGPFDGNILNSGVKVNGSPVTILAESERKVVFSSPSAPGPCELTVTEQGKTSTGTYSNLSVRLSAGQTTLRPGDRTPLECVVSGFAEPPKAPNLPTFELTMLTPNIARGEEIPGDVIRHLIQPEDVKDGVYRYQCTLVGIQPGSFSVSAKVLFFWPWSKTKEPNPMLTKPPTPETSPFFKCCWLITIGPGKGAGDVDHSAVAIDGKVYSFEGNGMNVYPNVGAYLNKRKFEDGRQVWVNPVQGVDKDAMRKKAKEIIDGGKPYDLFTNNCALNAGALLEAGGVKDLLKEVKPLRLKNRNENLGAIGKAQEITEKQIE